MRSITIKQLDANLFNELKDLPLAVTRYGKPYVVIEEAETEEIFYGSIEEGTQTNRVNVIDVIKRAKPVVSDLSKESIKKVWKKQNKK